MIITLIISLFFHAGKMKKKTENQRSSLFLENRAGQQLSR